MSTLLMPLSRGSRFLARRRRSYFLFVVPALVVVGAVIVFPWAFTLWMSVNRLDRGQSAKPLPG